ncbi:PREDICTED: gibberellin 2-beta-dioxygenase 1-like [Ipomoea nil]|uniref:gibberellin 2-beta-dioxygenase 1-like n=1 Tax=Ipomoea nil TaxID=35883 RepID=UPI000900D8BA|nr:PREDICTED: gibberellin 2-beta-dioxygenase 1-like [Ipomoea nil]
MAEGLKIHPKNVLSRLVMDKESDSMLRLNHYPPCPELQEINDRNLIGFGEHTDPQIISVLRSNNTSGLQISLKDGCWISVLADQSSFFINVGDFSAKNFGFSSVDQMELLVWPEMELLPPNRFKKKSPEMELLAGEERKNVK